MISSFLTTLTVLIFGNVYPAYSSFKAVRTKNVKQYLKWTMYWIVFAIFTCLETFTYYIFGWFPFYDEIKILILFWMISPATEGSTIVYRKFVHPVLCNKEEEIDDYIKMLKRQSYTKILHMGSMGLNALGKMALNALTPAFVPPSGSGMALRGRTDGNRFDLDESSNSNGEEEVLEKIEEEKKLEDFQSGGTKCKRKNAGKRYGYDKNGKFH